MLALLCIFSLVLWVDIIGKKKPGIHICKAIVYALCGFFFLYTIVAAGFFWADRFSFAGTLLVCLLIQAVLAVRLGRRVPRFDWDLKKYGIPLAIMLFALPFTWNKYELYSMGQDQGTYQVKALALMEYDTHNYMEMREFGKLDTPEERQKYLDFVYGQNNLYLPRVIEETQEDASRLDRIVGTIHGLPTYSALLGLWGKIFGYEHMIGVQTPLYLCLIFLTYLLAQKAGLRKSGVFLVTLLNAFSPIVLWISKSSLTELGLAVIFAAFLNFLCGERENARYAWIPLAVFAFFHISIYVFMPILITVLFLMYVIQEERGWLYSALGTLLAYAVSAFWAFSIEPYYSYGNYSVLWKLMRDLINENNIKPVILGAVGLLGALAVFLLTGRGGRLALRLKEGLTGRKWFVPALSWSCRLILAGSAAFFLYKGVIRAEYIRYLEYLQFSAYIYMTGLLLIPFLYLYWFWRPERGIVKTGMGIWMLMFFYFVIAYSMFMRFDLRYYYYFARYVTIFLLVVFIPAAKGLEDISPRGRVSAAALLLAALSFLPYDAGFVTQKDHSRCEWETLGDICEDITAQDAFLVGPEEQEIVFIFPVKLLTGCDVYYTDEDLSGQLKKLTKRYPHVYYLDYDGALEDKMAEGGWEDSGLSIRKIYTNWNHLSYLDYMNITHPWTPLPINYVEYRLKLSLHEISGNG